MSASRVVSTGDSGSDARAGEDWISAARVEEVAMMAAAHAFRHLSGDCELMRDGAGSAPGIAVPRRFTRWALVASAG